ncbi:hypothetical protein [Nonomuraea sp. NPDC052265]
MVQGPRRVSQTPRRRAVTLLIGSDSFDDGRGHSVIGRLVRDLR